MTDEEYYAARREEYRRMGRCLTLAQREVVDEARDPQLSDEEWAERYISRCGNRNERPA